MTVERMSYDEVAATLTAWVGEPVEVLIGPSPQSPVYPELKVGIVYAKAFWDAPSKQPRRTVGFARERSTCGHYRVSGWR